MKSERIFYLDFIRVLSMILIVVYHFDCSLVGHAIQGHQISLGFIPISDLGTTGVSLFFIISGAALMNTYKNDFSIKHYFCKRFISIYPMFWLAYFIAFAFLYFYHFFHSPINHINPEKWTFLLTILGLDGYLLYKIPNFYILGEWFLGCIILLYLCFPLLRQLIIKYPKLLISISGLIYIILVENYTFEMPIVCNLFTRLPIFLFGMFFIIYIRNINIYQFIGASCISEFLLFSGINIQPMNKITIIGIFLFIALTFMGKHITNEKIKKIFELISKYSYAVFLTHHVIIEFLLKIFNNREISYIKSYCLFVIVCILIIVSSIYLYKISHSLSQYLNEWCLFLKNKKVTQLR